MTECKFEVGKWYKTREGSTRKVVAIWTEPDKFGHQMTLLNCKGGSFLRRIDGKFTEEGGSNFDLLPEECASRKRVKTLRELLDSGWELNSSGDLVHPEAVVNFVLSAERSMALWCGKELGDEAKNLWEWDDEMFVEVEE